MSEADWYAVLDVPEDCSSEDVKAAYRRKLLETHPDKNTNSSLDVSIALHDIKEAFRILTDCDLRSQFDSRRDAVLTKGINAREATLQEFSIETTRTGDTLYRLACRCGDYFEVEEGDVGEDCDLLLQCSGCTLYVRLLTGVDQTPAEPSKES